MATLSNIQTRPISLENDPSPPPLLLPSTKRALSPLRPPSQLAPTHQPSLLFLLPAEIRRQIYSEVFSISTRLTTSSWIVYNCAIVIGSGPHLALLQSCQQIYTEARLVPFESNIFQFHRWSGASTFECRKFLCGLRPWQIDAVRELRLRITEHEIRGLGTKGAREAFVAVCRQLGDGLRRLTLHVDPQAVVWKSPATTSGGDEEQAGKSAWWVDGRDGRWITDGLGLLKALRVLNVRTFPESLMVAAADAGDGQEGGREICEKALREKLPWCEKVIVSLHKK